MDRDVATLKGVGDQVAKKLSVLGIKTVSDLVQNYPRKYEDYSELTEINRLRPGQVTIKVRINQAKGRYARRGMHITEAVASDKSGSVKLVWFNQPYRVTSIKAKEEYYVSGVFGISGSRLSLTNPSMELVKDFPLNTARIVPIYRETKGLKSGLIRKIVAGLQPEIDDLPEILPEKIIEQNDLISRAQAVSLLHFPKTSADIEMAKKRLGFDEVFVLSLAALINKQANQKQNAPKIEFKLDLAKKFVSKLPFELTGAQRKVIWQIYKDLEKSQPMNRLIEGDVGSGKTVVAAMSAMMAISEGYQVAMMAPTEILARQHAESLHKLMSYVGLQDSLVLLVGGIKAGEKKRAHERIAGGQAKLIIGTHALISEKVDMHSLGLVIIDEQHRFGVSQRTQLSKKAGHMPHILSMTATPIPRTLALTLYGELDISLLDEMPPGRKPIMTKVLSQGQKSSLYKKMEQEIGKGRQIFVVCPLISESDFMQALSAEKVYEELANGPFKSLRVGLLHGKMKDDKKDETMQKFVEGQIDILVSTTVVEVGVDVPNASTMVIEGAERFGLAQIHQLRGRVGRNTEQGYCYLVMSDNSPPTKRLRAAEQSNDGFRLAELDLEIRGPGAIYGHMQHGQLDLRIASLTDVRLISKARAAAQNFIDSKLKLKDYPELSKHVVNSQKVTTLN